MTLTIPGDEQPRVGLYVRGDMFGANDQQRAVVRRLAELEDQGRIEGYEVHVWEGQVSLDTGRASETVAQYETLESWAEEADIDIGPFFDVRERESFIDGQVRDLILPVMCLTVYDDDGVSMVAPHVDPASDETRSIYDCLDALGELDAAERRVAVAAE